MVPSGGLSSKICLGNFQVSISFGEVGLLDSDVSVSLLKEESVLNNSLFGFSDGFGVKLDKVVVYGELSGLVGVEVSKGGVEGVEEILEEGEDLLGGGSTSVFL